MCCHCCNNTKNLGCFDPCGIQFETGANVPVGEAGEWTLYIAFNRRIKAYRNTLIEGQPINFTVGCITPYYTYKAYIAKPDGTIAVFSIDGTGFDCFEFTTNLEAGPGISMGATSVT